MTHARISTMTWVKSKHRLAALWFIGAGFILMLVLLGTIFGELGVMRETWSWLLPALMPTLLMMIGVLVEEATSSRKPKKKGIDRFTYRLSFALSLAYLVAVSSILLLAPFSQAGRLELMKQSNIWLGPFQGLVAASLGAFFVRATDPSPGKRTKQPG